MKKYFKFYILTVVQALMFYILPLFAGPTDIMGLVVLLIISTFIISMLMGIYKYKIKFLFPFVVAIIFLPSVFIYYNDSALVHALWYCVVSFLGISIGSLINLVISLINKK